MRSGTMSRTIREWQREHEFARKEVFVSLGLKEKDKLHRLVAERFPETGTSKTYGTNEYNCSARPGGMFYALYDVP